jgi:excinuclease ABC subunit C
MDMAIVEKLRQRTHLLPQEPGVYLMKDGKGEIIYIGKAKSLKNRVSSYFRSVERHQAKVYHMVENVRDFDYIVTDSEFEALVLEASLIKLHTPKYNILLKDAKGYFYVGISPGPYSRLTFEMQKDRKDMTYLGPYTSSMVVKQTVDEANKAFLLPTCTRRFPEDFGKGRPCLNFHIKQCMGVCTGKISPERYGEAFGEALAFIKGGGSQSVEELTQKMEEAAESLDFERAARYRDRIKAIQRITAQQKVMAYHHKSLDVIAAVQGTDTIYISVLVFRGGRLRDKLDFTFDCFESIENVIGEFILNYYPGREDGPSELFLDRPVPDQELLAQLISQGRGKKLTISVPARGQGLQLVEMAQNNAAQTLATKTRRTGREMTAVGELGLLLGLETPPAYIEAYDISNFGGQTIVGGMVVFENGRPLRKAYKKFTIRDQAQPDDYSAMDQMLSRRVARYLEGPRKGEGFDRLPDLWLIDGGAGHVKVAEEVLARNGISIPVFGMVKDSRHRTRAITSQDQEIAISANKGVFALVTTIQDEVHRYSIEFSRKSHGKSAMNTKLMEVEGIGEARASALYRHFKTYKAISQATVEELASVKGMTFSAAKKLHQRLHETDEKE